MEKAAQPFTLGHSSKEFLFKIIAGGRGKTFFKNFFI